MLQKAEQEKALKEKIDAQKKARMEAAERSKNLARAFAEKKKSASQASSRNVSGRLISEGVESSVVTTAVAINCSRFCGWTFETNRLTNNEYYVEIRSCWELARLAI